MYYVYILRCGDDSFYTGITTDVARRVSEHKEGKGARYTRARGVKALLHTERKLNRSTATKREATIKRMSRKEKLALVEDSKNKIGRGQRKNLEL